MTNERLTRDQQREAARAKAKAMREAQKIKAGRRKVIMLSSAVVGSLALVGGIFWYATSNPAPIVEPDTNPSTAIFDGGVRIGKDLKVITSAADVDPTVPNIVIYEDLQCPACRAFEAPNMPQIRELVASGKYTVQIHPISFLDGSSVNEYSSRAANALLCVADTQADKFLDFNGALYSNQPSEGTPGPTNEQLQSLAAEAGVTNKATLDCMATTKWNAWAKNKGSVVWTEKVPGTNLDFSGTPFVMVNGQQYRGETANAAMFLQWLQTVAPVS